MTYIINHVIQLSDKPFDAPLMLQTMLQVPSSRLAALLARCPHLLLLPPESLQDTWSCLRDCLKLPRQQLATRMMQQPQLLRMPADIVRRRITRLASALRWDEAQVIRLARNQIQLLAASPLTVAGKVPALAATLGVTKQIAHDMARRQPALLSLSTTTVRRNLEGLEAVLLRPGQRGDLPNSVDVRSRKSTSDLTGSSPHPHVPVSSKASWMTEWGDDSPMLGLIGDGGATEEVPMDSYGDTRSYHDRHLDLIHAVDYQPTLLTISPGTLSKKFDFISSFLRLGTTWYVSAAFSTPIDPVPCLDSLLPSMPYYIFIGPLKLCYSSTLCFCLFPRLTSNT